MFVRTAVASCCGRGSGRRGLGEARLNWEQSVLAQEVPGTGSTVQELLKLGYSADQILQILDLSTAQRAGVHRMLATIVPGTGHTVEALLRLGWSPGQIRDMLLQPSQPTVATGSQQQQRQTVPSGGSAWDKLTAWFNQPAFGGLSNGAAVAAGGGGLLLLSLLLGRRR